MACAHEKGEHHRRKHGVTLEPEERNLAKPVYLVVSLELATGLELVNGSKMGAENPGGK